MKRRIIQESVWKVDSKIYYQIVDILAMIKITLKKQTNHEYFNKYKQQHPVTTKLVQHGRDSQINKCQYGPYQTIPLSKR